MIRIFLKQKNFKEPLISIFVGNLPNGLSQIQYERILIDNLKNNNCNYKKLNYNMDLL